MELVISNSSDRPIYEQIYQQIKTSILTGKVEAGEALPSIRALAKDLHISVITTKRAYDLLEADGLIETMLGKGTYVSMQNKELMKEETLRRVEDQLTEIVALLKFNGVTQDELFSFIQLLYEEDAK